MGHFPSVASIIGGSKRRAVARARAVACRWLVDDLGIRGSDVARRLGVTPAAVSVALRRGRALGGSADLPAEDASP